MKREAGQASQAAHDEPEFGEFVTAQERNPDTRLIVNAHNIDLTPDGGYTAITLAK